MARAGELEEFFALAGGENTFRLLVKRFYEGVADDPVLRPLYPEEDLGPAEDRLAQFLIQYWGGPATYSETRGHPRLRLRHSPFRIGEVERDRWLTHMREALTSLELAPNIERPIWNYLTMAVDSLRNVDDNVDEQPDPAGEH